MNKQPNTPVIKEEYNPEKEYAQAQGFTLGQTIYVVEWEGKIYACADKETAKAIGKSLKWNYEMGGGMQWGDPYIRATKVRTATPKAIQQISQLKESKLKETHTSMTKLPDLNKWWEYPKEDILAVVYWIKRELPPQDAAKREAEWVKVRDMLQRKFPAPNKDNQ